MNKNLLLLDPDTLHLLVDLATISGNLTLAENLQSGFFKPEQSEVLRLFHDPDLMHYAEEVQTDDDLEVDDEPIFSKADNGCWVGAWVFIRDANPDED